LGIHLNARQRHSAFANQPVQSDVMESRGRYLKPPFADVLSRCPLAQISAVQDIASCQIMRETLMHGVLPAWSVVVLVAWAAALGWGAGRLFRWH